METYLSQGRRQTSARLKIMQSSLRTTVKTKCDSRRLNMTAQQQVGVATLTVMRSRRNSVAAINQWLLRWRAVMEGHEQLF